MFSSTYLAHTVTHAVSELRCVFEEFTLVNQPTNQSRSGKSKEFHISGGHYLLVVIIIAVLVFTVLTI